MTNPTDYDDTDLDWTEPPTRDLPTMSFRGSAELLAPIQPEPLRLLLTFWAWVMIATLWYGLFLWVVVPVRLWRNWQTGRQQASDERREMIEALHALRGGRS